MNYTEEQLRRIDALVELHVMGHDVEWRWCHESVEYQYRWREMHEYHETHQIERWEKGWTKHPCVVVASAGEHKLWRMSTWYTTDHNACAEMRKRLGAMSVYGDFISVLHDEIQSQMEHVTTRGLEGFMVDATPLQQCLAALAACGVDVEKELKNDSE